MTKLKYLTIDGKPQKEIEVPENIFELKPNLFAIHRAVVIELKNKKVVGTHVKTRGLVSGGGKKPWKQKGTGRARVGSIRSPLWKGGGKIGIPKHVFKVEMPKKELRRAISMALSDKRANNLLFIIDSIELQGFKTKDFLSFIGKLPIVGRLLYIRKEIPLFLETAARNISFITLVKPEYVSLGDILKHKTILIDQKSLDLLINRLEIKKYKVTV